MILARYITKEILAIFSVTLIILIFIAISNKFVIFLAKAATGELPLGLVLKIVGLYIPELFCFLAPIALFVAALFVHSRLYVDNEAPILLTSGFAWRQLTGLTLKIAIVLAVIVASFTLAVIPNVIKQREKLLADGQASGIINAITPGQFQMANNENLVFYVEDVLPDGRLHNIFIAERDGAVITAKSAQIQQIGSKEFYLVLFNGQRYEGKPGNADYRVTHFEEYGREIKYQSQPVPGFDRVKPTLSLFNSSHPGDHAELQWRLAMPIALLVLALMAVPLAKVNPRQGKFTRIVPAILIYIAYYNFMTMVKRLVGTGSLSPHIGIWAVHAVFLTLAIFLYLQASGRWHQLTHSFFKGNKW